MIQYVVRRLLQAAAVVLFVTMIVFFLAHLLPGSEARAILGPRATSVEIAAFNRQFGLDRPLLAQYLSYLSQLAHGNLGFSYKLNQSVASLLATDLPRDVLLVGSALVVSLVIAVPVGIYQAVRRNHGFDHAATGVSFVLYSMPSFALGLLLVAWFAVDLKWFPAQAPQQPSFASVLSDPRAMVLPVLTIALVNVALFSRYLRSSAIDTLTQDHIRTAQAKGLSRRRILSHHLLRNSLVPIVTLLGLSLPALFTAGLVSEQIFNYPGTGLAFYTAATTQDYPVELGVTLVVGIATVVGNLFADLAYAALDPRVRYV